MSNLRTQLVETNSYDTFIRKRESKKLWSGATIAAQVTGRVDWALGWPNAEYAADPVEANGWIY